MMKQPQTRRTIKLDKTAFQKGVEDVLRFTYLRRGLQSLIKAFKAR